MFRIPVRRFSWGNGMSVSRDCQATQDPATTSPPLSLPVLALLPIALNYLSISLALSQLVSCVLFLACRQTYMMQTLRCTDTTTAPFRGQGRCFSGSEAVVGDRVCDNGEAGSYNLACILDV